jgi:hypothetical protein
VVATGLTAAAGEKPAFAIKEAKRVMGSPFPPEDWRKVEFDDGDWVRSPGPLPNSYRSLAMICLRGKFRVGDPAGVSELGLSINSQGGLVMFPRAGGTRRSPGSQQSTTSQANRKPPRVMVPGSLPQPRPAWRSRGRTDAR